MEEKKDIFDRLFSIRLLRAVQPIYQTYKEQLLYVFFGGLTTVISIAAFSLFTLVIPFDELVANLISWFAAVLFAFLTNRTWVFQTDAKQSFVKQMVSFYLGRVTTLGVEELILLLFVKILSVNALLVKVVAQIIVVLLIYIISKVFVFRKGE